MNEVLYRKSSPRFVQLKSRLDIIVYVRYIVGKLQLIFFWLNDGIVKQFARMHDAQVNGHGQSNGKFEQTSINTILKMCYVDIMLWHANLCLKYGSLKPMVRPVKSAFSGWLSANCFWMSKIDVTTIKVDWWLKMNGRILSHCLSSTGESTIVWVCDTHSFDLNIKLIFSNLFLIIWSSISCRACSSKVWPWRKPYNSTIISYSMSTLSDDVYLHRSKHTRINRLVWPSRVCDMRFDLFTLVRRWFGNIV